MDFYEINNGSATAPTSFGTQGPSYQGYSNTFGVSIGEGIGVVVGTVMQSNFPTGVWYHYVAVYEASQSTDATRLKIYINGVQQALAFSASLPLSAAAGTSLIIGKDVADSSYFNGKIDDVRIYNRALSATEVANLYQTGGAVRASASSAELHNGSSLQSGLVGHWTFDGKDTPWSSATAGTAIDRSGNNSNGILTQMNRATSPTIGKLGQGLNFDGSTNYVNINAATSTIKTGSFSVAFWFKPGCLIDATHPGQAQTIFSLSDYSSQNDIQVQ